MYLYDLKTIKAPYSLQQEDSLNWLSQAWAKKQGKSPEDLKKIFSRVAVRPEQIQKRSFFLPEFFVLPESSRHQLPPRMAFAAHWRTEARQDKFAKQTEVR